MPNTLFDWYADSLAQMERERIAPSEQAVIRRMLDPGGRATLQRFFKRLEKQMPVNVAARIVDVMIRNVLLFGPSGWQDPRADFRDVSDTLDDIAKHASQLANAIDRLWRVTGRGAVGADTDLYSIFALIEGAAGAEGGELAHRYQCYVKSQLDSLQAQFDGKYFPAVSSIIRHIGANAEHAYVELDPTADAAAMTRDKSAADMIRAILHDLDTEAAHIRNSEIAAFLNATTDSGASEDQVRKARKRYESEKPDNSL